MPDYDYGPWTYVPTEKQKQLHAAREQYVLYGGARGPGKTRGVLEHVKETMERWPGIPILLGRRDLADLKKTTEREWREKVCPPWYYDPANGGQHHKTENWYRFPNGSTLYLAELKDVESWRSATLGMVAIDEAKEIKRESDIADLSGSLRWISSLPGLCERPECVAASRDIKQAYTPHGKHPRYQIVMASNPGGGWLKQRFWVPWKNGHERPNHKFIPATAFENPNLPPGYIKDLLENNPARWVQNFVYGDWSAFENMAYPNFERALHLWRTPVIPFDRFRRVVGGIDYGSTGTEAHKSALYLTAELKDGRYLTFHEYLKQGAPSKELFALVAQLNTKYRVERWKGDASQFIANNALRDLGIQVDDAPRYKGAVKAGINLGDLLMAPGATGEPQWHYTENCTWLPAALESYKMNEETGEAIKKDDDACDAWRYSIMGIAEGRVTAPLSREWKTKTGETLTRSRASSILAAKKAARSARMRQVLANER